MFKRYFNVKIETLPASELKSLAERKLIEQISYIVQLSDFYKEKFKKHGLARRHVSKILDLHLIPFTLKDELRVSQEMHPPLGNYRAAPMEKVIRIHASSGTTGVPSYVGITRRDKAAWTEMAARCAYARGVRPGSIVVHAYALSFFVGGLPVKDGIEEIGATFVPVGTGASELVVSAVKRLGADIISGTPSYMFYLADYMRERLGIDPRELKLKKIIGGGEPGIGVEAIRRRIEEVYGADAYEAMGNADLGPVIFAECEEKKGMHFLAPDYILPEVIDSKGEPLRLEEGCEGELVCTTLERECNPVLRFRTGDRVIVWTCPCPCGRTGFRIRCVGRTDEMLIVRGVNVFPSAIQDVVASFPGETTGRMEVQLPRPGPQVDPPVRIVVEYCGPPDLPFLKTKLETALREKLIFRAEVTLVPPGTLPRHQEKTSLVKVVPKEYKG